MGSFGTGRAPATARASAALLSGVALAALAGTPAMAQDISGQQAVAGQNVDDAGTAKAAAEKNAKGATLLDRVLLLSRTGETAIESLSSSSHIDQEQLDRRMASTVSEMLYGVPGVAVQTGAQRVRSTINIRGLQDAGRVAVLVDGARQNFGIMGHDAESLLFIDPDLVKQVDVIRGPVANTYGSGAIGGVVAFETKDASDFLHDGETWAASTTGRYETNGQGWTTGATGAYRFNDAADIIANIVWRDYGEYKDGDGDRVGGTGFDMLSGLVKTTIRPTENSELKLGWIGSKDDWSSVGGDENYDVKQNTFTARYNITDEDRKWLDLHINTSFSKVDMDRERASGITNYGLDTYGLDIWNTSRFDTGEFSHEVTYGGDWLMDDVATHAPGGGSDFFNPSGKRRLWGAYIQDKVTYDWLEVIGGLRYDNYSLKGNGVDNSGDRVSPRITVGVSPFDSEALSGLQFYGTYAEGYRAPTVAETLISGIHPGGAPFPFLPNPNLKPETAKTWEFGTNYRLNGIFNSDDNIRLKAAYFHNDVDDFIGFQEGNPTCSTPWPCSQQNQNFANAKIEGFELQSLYDAGWGYVGLSASVINGHKTDKSGIREELDTIPSAQVTGQLGLRFLEDRLLVGTEVQYNAAPRGNTVAGDYTLVNAFAQYNVNDNLKVDFRVDNLFDVTYVNALSDPSTGVLYEPGITLKLGATMRFGG
ncbi:ligand-gated channel [Pseudaminobacter manganicus]|uniref:Ligand-gated channel n=2 Tax=Manganibacter manganicus TaxID=1873176 RepID=A0A1V8RWG8_9HYPH|nr:TonB-dependent hemoglobin/transferrin/lactoferrin family receptor [Pseudaminobacter manganicus]OQM77522.1 ligand-gated channel [Pseudaminobacter manganicus]